MNGRTVFSNRSMQIRVMYPSDRKNTTTTTRIFGMKVRVTSWIDVRAWINPIVKPTTSVPARMGIAIIAAPQI